MIRDHPIQNDALMMITAVLAQRRRIFAEPVYAHEAIETLYRLQGIRPFFLYGFVFMPDHCHVLMRVPAPGSISKIVGSFKYGVSMNIGKGPLWQPRFHMRIPEDPASTLRYIHWNPVRAGLAKSPEKFPWSSASGRWDVSPLLGWNL